nr:MAG TPA: hemolysin [Caudoviricetes sp.]DAV88201.1 MAG TPA: hemolysin [Caudoviricetes sp.]
MSFDMSTIIVALLALIGTLTGAYLSNNKTKALLAYRLERLEERVNKHNSLVERTYHIEEEQEIIKEKIKVANHRIDDLEREKGKG